MQSSPKNAKPQSFSPPSGDAAGEKPGVDWASISGHLRLAPLATLVPYAAVFFTVFGARLALIALYGLPHPFWDAWEVEASWFYKPLLSGTMTVADWWRNASEHRPVILRLYDLFLLTINGQWDVRLQMVTNAALFAVFTCLLFRIVARRMCGWPRLAMAAFIALVMSSPVGWENTLDGHHAGWYLFYLLAVGGLALVAERQPFERAWVLGAVCLAASYFALFGGIVAIAAAVVVLLLRAIWDGSVQKRMLYGAGVLAAMLAGGFVIEPSFPNRGADHAASLVAMLRALLYAVFWPHASLWPWNLLVPLPFVMWLVLSFLNRRRAVPSFSLVVLGTWVLLESAAMSLARGGDGAPPLSRYQEILAIGLVVNAAALWELRPYLLRRFGARWTGALAAVWILSIGSGLFAMTSEARNTQLPAKLAMGLRQQDNLRGFVATGDLAPLEGQPLFDIGYYHGAQSLAALLDDREIRRILPSSIREPLSVIPMQLDRFYTDGYPDTTPRLHDGPIYGSYGGEPLPSVFSSVPIAAPGLPYLEFLVATSPEVSGLSLELLPETAAGGGDPVAVTLYPRDAWMMQGAVETQPGVILLQPSVGAPLNSIAKGFQLDPGEDYYCSFEARWAGGAKPPLVGVELLSVASDSSFHGSPGQQQTIAIPARDHDFHPVRIAIRTASDAGKNALFRLFVNAPSAVEVRNVKFSKLPHATTTTSSGAAVSVRMKPALTAGWTRVHVRAPDGPFRIVVRTSAADQWIAFSPPREIGRWSVLADWLAGSGAHVFWAGLLIFCLCAGRELGLRATIRHP